MRKRIGAYTWPIIGASVSGVICIHAAAKSADALSGFLFVGSVLLITAGIMAYCQSKS